MVPPLNCGFRSRISGETDFPCIYGERVGLGRSYVQVPELTSAADLKYEDWVQGLKAGRSYVSDGLSHLLQFSVGDQQLGTIGSSDQSSQLNLVQAGKQTVRCQVAAMLPETRDLESPLPLDGWMKNRTGIWTRTAGSLAMFRWN
ncbi:MAG: hypothetical protein R3C53_28405 [Pirellulaceae bacterium]